MLWWGTGSAYCLGRKYQIKQHLFSTLVRSCQWDVLYSELWHCQIQDGLGTPDKRRLSAEPHQDIQCFYSFFLPFERVNIVVAHYACFFHYSVKPLEEKEGNGEGFGEKKFWTSVNLIKLAELYMQTDSRCRWELNTQTQIYTVISSHPFPRTHTLIYSFSRHYQVMTQSAVHNLRTCLSKGFSSPRQCHT